MLSPFIMDAEIASLESKLEKLKAKQKEVLDSVIHELSTWSYNSPVKIASLAYHVLTGQKYHILNDYVKNSRRWDKETATHVNIDHIFILGDDQIKGYIVSEESAIFKAFETELPRMWRKIVAKGCINHTKYDRHNSFTLSLVEFAEECKVNTEMLIIGITEFLNYQLYEYCNEEIGISKHWIFIDEDF